MRTLPACSAGSSLRFRVVVTQTILVSILLAACTSRVSVPVSNEAILTNVVDGDTVVLRFGDRQEERVRLLGIDTPETVDPTRPVQCFGHEAAVYLDELLPPGTNVIVERDVEARDRFGRLLVYLYRASDDLFVNAEMLRSGFADLSIFEPNSTYRDALTVAATSARTANVGLWESCGGPDVPLDPSEYDE